MKLGIALRNGLYKIYNSQIRSGVEDGYQCGQLIMWQDTNFMKRNPFCEAHTHLANYAHFTGPQVSLRGHTVPSLVLIWKQMTAVQIILLHLFKSHSHSILPSTLVFPSGLHKKNHVSAYISSHAFYVSRPTHATFNHSNII